MLLLILSGCAVQSHKPFAAPTLLPGTDRHMLTAGYWISRHPSPDALILTTEQIAELNLHIKKDLKTVSDITPNSAATFRERSCRRLAERH